MTTTILLIRHGQTDWNEAGRWQGHLDVPLNETGQAQVKALAKRLADCPIQAVYSSDLRRAAMTAVPLAAALNLEPIFDPIWRERDLGDFAGMTVAESRAAYPAVWGAMKNGALNPPNGEAHLALRARAIAAYKKVWTQHEAEMVAVVSHGGTLANVISHILEIPADRYGRFHLSGNTGLSVIFINEKGDHRLGLLNDTSHLTKNGFYRPLSQATAQI